MMFGGSYKGRRVLITGHTGFKGSWLTSWLLRLGAKVTGVSNGTPTTPANFDVLQLSEKIQHKTATVTELAAIRTIFEGSQPEIVFHLAAQAIVRRSYEEPKLTFDTNAGGTINVLEAIRTTPSVRAAVFITSDKCYENVEWPFGYRETDRLGGKDPYSASKACAELAFSAYARSFFSNQKAPRIATTRAGNVIGGGDWAPDRIVPDCIRAWSRKESALLRNPIATRPWQHVLEPLSGYLWLGSRLLFTGDGLSHESFNFGPSADVNQPVEKLVDEMRRSWPEGRWHTAPVEGKELKAEAGLLKLSCDKALYLLGWQPTLTFGEAVEMTTTWYRNYYEERRNMAEYTASQIGAYERLGSQRGRSWAQ